MQTQISTTHSGPRRRGRPETRSNTPSAPPAEVMPPSSLPLKVQEAIQNGDSFKAADRMRKELSRGPRRAARYTTGDLEQVYRLLLAIPTRNADGGFRAQHRDTVSILSLELGKRELPKRAELANLTFAAGYEKIAREHFLRRS